MASEIGDSIYLQISVRDIVEGMRDRVLTTQFAPWRASAQLWIYILDRVEPRLAAVDSILVAATEELRVRTIQAQSPAQGARIVGQEKRADRAKGGRHTP